MVQRREIDSVCLFFVMVGVVSFFTQMLQVESASAAIYPLPVFKDKGKSQQTLSILSNEHILKMENTFLYPAEKLFCK